MSTPYHGSKVKIVASATALSLYFFAGCNSACGKPNADQLCVQADNESMLYNTRQNALGHINQALAIQPNNPIYWRVKAQVLQRLDEAEKALPCITKSLELNAKDSEALSVKSDILLVLGRSDQALTAIEQALKTSDHPCLHMGRANIFKIQRKYDLAERELDNVVKAYPNDLIARSKRADIAALTKHWQKAIDDQTFTLKRAKTKNFSYYQGLLCRAEAYTAAKQYNKAIADCKEGIKGQPDMRQFHVALIKVYTLTGNKASAESERKQLDAIEDDYRPTRFGGF